MDEQSRDFSSQNSDKPLAQLAQAERAVEPRPDPMSAVDRLRAYEDEVLGKDAVRIGGKIERGVGSPYAEMSDEQRAKYEAIERLIVCEQKLADAHTALIAADAEHEAAEAAVNG